MSYWAFYSLFGFGSFSINCTATYYVNEKDDSRIYKLDSDWNLVDSWLTAFLTMNTPLWTRPALMIRIGNSFFMTLDNYVLKTDWYLNVIAKHFDGGGVSSLWRGIWYNSSSSLIYAACNYWKRIDVFDLNVIKIDSFNTSVNSSIYNPWSLQGYNDKIYIGTDQGVLLVTLSKVIIQTIKMCKVWSRLSSILFDHNGYVAFTCRTESVLILYNSAYMNYTGIQLNVPASPEFISFDEKGRFIVISDSQITVYN